MAGVTQPSTLYIVATPIGHLDDLSPRACAVLAAVNGILAEDTRQSCVLLRHAGITTPMQALHEHNEAQRAEAILARLRAGESLALISDAGTPLISDPGYRLVAAVRAAGFAVSPVPGPSALIAALSVAGLPTDRFAFEGFLPAKAGERAVRLTGLVAETRTLVFYEAPHRVLETLIAMQEAFGANRRAVLARELTKRFETVLDGTLSDLVARVRVEADQQRGEIVLVVAGADPEAIDARLAEGKRLYALRADELPPARAAKLAAQWCGVRKRDLYGGES